MSALRPMSTEGYQALSDEIDRLWHDERPMVTAEVSRAAEMGDRSENAAYIYGKKRLRAIDSRLRYLRKKFELVQPVDLSRIPPSDLVKWGAVVDVEHEDGTPRTWRLVDKDESEPKASRISAQSPVGRALLGKRAGDVIEVSTPRGPIEYEVLAVRYGADGP